MESSSKSFLDIFYKDVINNRSKLILPTGRFRAAVSPLGTARLQKNMEHAEIKDILKAKKEREKSRKKYLQSIMGKIGDLAKIRTELAKPKEINEEYLCPKCSSKLSCESVGGVFSGGEFWYWECPKKDCGYEYAEEDAGDCF